MVSQPPSAVARLKSISRMLEYLNANPRSRLGGRHARILHLSLLAIALGLAVAPSRGGAQSSNAAQAKSPDEKYVLGADSRPQPGVPEGKVTEFTLDDSKVYPGYRHKWW